MWNAAVEVARVDGVDSTARTLRVDRGLLARRVELASAPSESVSAAIRDAERERARDGFIELDARRWCGPGQMVVRFEGRDGEKLQLELSGACTLNALDLARAFWSRAR